MFDIERFDQWVALNDNDQEANELAEVVRETIMLTESLLGSSAAHALACEIVHDGLESAYGSVEGHEALAHLELGDSTSAVEQLFADIDLLNFKFAKQANGLKCYAMTGMIEGESSADTYEEKRQHLLQLVEWGRMICGIIPEEKRALRHVRSMVAAAEARLSLDLEYPVDTIAFAHLASLFREGSPEQVRKTLQNQISAKQLAVNERRQLLPESAHQFLKGAPGFPSIWMLADQEALDLDPVDEPIFIPLCPATGSTEERPFLPSERHSDGYRIGAGASARSVDDYWEALRWLAQSPEPAFRPVGYEHPVRCKNEWSRVDKKLLESELASLTASGSPRSITQQVHLRLMKRLGIEVHPLGHTDKVYRYRAPSGVELALEKRIGEPWLYARQGDLPAVAEVDHVDVTATKRGRNSNLNALPTFAGQPLRKYRLKSPADLDAILSDL